MFDDRLQLSCCVALVVDRDEFARPVLTPPPPDKCGSAKFHTRQKHAMVESYFRVWTNNVKKDAQPRQRPSLDIVDLFASYGWCHDADESKETWEGTAIRAAHCLAEYETSNGKRLFLNTFHPDESVLSFQSAALKDAVAAIGGGIRVYYETRDVVAAYERIEPRVSRDYPNVWILDPYKPHDLPWSLVAHLVKNHQGEKPKRSAGKIVKVTRKPELFVTLMTYQLQMNAKPNPWIVTESLGLGEEDWRSRLERCLSDGLNHTEAFLEIYLEQLATLYSRQPAVRFVRGNDGNIVYAFIFCSDEEPGIYTYKQVALPKYDEWHEHVFTPKVTQIHNTRVKARAKARVESEIAKNRAKHGGGLGRFF